MEWSKVKNITIFMLAITNLLLLFLVAVPRTQQQIAEEEGLLSAITLLSQRGISVDSAIIPKSIDLSPQSITPDRTTESTLAAALLGDAISMTDLGGSVYHYSSHLGIMRFHSGGEFTAQFEAGVLPLDQLSTESHGQTIVDSLQIDTILTSITREDDGFSMVYNQLWDEVPLLDYHLTLCYKNDCLVQITSAKRLAGTAVITSSTDFPVSTALMQFLVGLQQLGDICRSITAITPAYGSTTDLSGTVQLTPLWCIATDTGSYQLNLLTGSLSRM